MKLNNYRNSLLVFSLLLTGFLSFAQHAESVSVNQLEEIFKEKTKLEKDGTFMNRYKIQLYYGDLQGANKVLSTYRHNFTQWTSDIEYEAPDHKVWIGNYRNRLEADRALIKIRRVFPTAIVFQPKKKKKS